MAKWGEGDPRWIVEERPDATNVNNWHWTEKNADHWSKKKLEALFVNYDFNEEGFKVTFNEMEKCEGEARANNRKAKLIFFYEWELMIKWKSVIDEEDIEGKVTIPNLSEEHTDMKDVDIEVTLTSSGNSKAGQRVKESLRKGKGAVAIRGQLQKYVDCLKSEFTAGLILPKAGEASTSTTSKKEKTSNGAFNSTTVNKSASSAMKGLDLGGSSKKSSNKIECETIEMSERFKCTGQELYNVLTQKEMLQVFTSCPVKMGELKKGAEFELLDGSIQGQFEGLTPFSKITQKWRLKTWPAGHFSNVEFKITQKSDDTELEIKQTNVPRAEVEKTRQGWSRYYVDAIKRNFGFGVVGF